MKKLQIAAWIMIVHGGVMEVGALIMLLPLMAGAVSADSMAHYFSFALPYFQNNLEMMMVMSGIFGAARIMGAIGVLKNRMWGFGLSVINCLVTMVLMLFLLPAGIADGLLAVSALTLLLMGFFGTRSIIAANK